MSTAADTTRFRRRGERGATTVLIAALGLALIMATGLVVDGGRKLGALSEARDAADNAARAGAQMIDTDSYRSSGEPVLDPAAATTRANTYLTAHGYTGTVAVNGPTVTVTVTITVPTRFLPGPFVVTATESATAVVGI
jgi:Flp pilus assembly protein TadG